MTRPDNWRLPALDTAPRATNAVEQLLDMLGAGSPVANDVIGDLADEYAQRVQRDGTASARWWYARQATRAVPYLLWNAARHGEPEARARLLALLGGTAFASLVAVVLWQVHIGPPARLVAGYAESPNHVVVSTVRPVKIPLQVLDARGHQLPDSAVRYAWLRGNAAYISPEGTAQCMRTGNTLARATLGTLVTQVRIDCQPVAQLHMKHWYNLVLGNGAEDLHVGGFDYDGRPVTRLSAVASIDDPSVARIEGKRLHPLRPGRAFVTVTVGERTVMAAVTVFEAVKTLAELRPDQRFVMAPVRLAPGHSVRWPLPEGDVWLVNQVNEVGDAPTMEVSGARCDPLPAPGVYRTECYVGAGGAWVTLSWPSGAPAPIESMLALERTSMPRPPSASPSPGSVR